MERVPSNKASGFCAAGVCRQIVSLAGRLGQSRLSPRCVCSGSQAVDHRHHNEKTRVLSVTRSYTKNDDSYDLLYADQSELEEALRPSTLSSMRKCFFGIICLDID